MVSVRGTFRNGAAEPEEVVEGYEGKPVLITFLQEPAEPSLGDDDLLGRLLETYAVETGIDDFAQQHDHYLHGQTKRDE